MRGSLISPEYYKVVGAPYGPNLDEMKMVEPMSPEEVSALKAEHGMPQEQLAVFMDEYSKGLLRVASMAEQNMPGGMPEHHVEAMTDDINRGCPVLTQTVKAEGYSETLAVGRPPSASADSINSLSPGTMFSPFMFLAGPACMARQVSDHLADYRPEDAQEAAAQQAADLVQLTAAVDLFDIEDIGGSPARHVAATGLNIPHVAEDGTQTVFKELHAWINIDNFSRLKMRFVGEMQAEGQTREFYLEKEDKDFRTVGNSAMYEPYHETLRMGGMLGEKERAQMAEAQKQLAEFEKQMAAMPASQRSMMESMMGPQLAQMRSLVNSGTVEFEFITSEIIINPDFSYSATSLLPGGEPDNLVKIIQGHLTTLGYDPGNTDGDLTKATVVAISKYQAANGMEVTGEATPQLAGILAAAVDAQK
jgi:hypothetical protein